MDKVLKRRLLGASILIALAVIFVPMLLVDPDAVDGRSVAEVEIPPMPESAREVRRIPLDPDSARPGSSRPQSEAEPGAEWQPDRQPDRHPERHPERQPEPVREPQVRVDPEIRLRPDEPVSRQEPGDPEPVSPAQASPAESADSTAGAVAEDADTGAAGDDFWVVQVASFGSIESADRVQGRLEALGHSVSRDEVVRGDSLLHRLRAGPYPDQRSADNAMQQIKTTIAGVEPVVQQLEGDRRPGQQPGFAVQVGVFVREQNATGESARLNGIGFDSFHYSELAGGREIWRVLVGPVVDRSAAEALKERLQDEAGVEGLVVSDP